MDDPLGFTARRPAYACKPVSAHRVRAEEPAERRENYGGELQESIDHCLTCKLKLGACTGEGGCTRERRRGRPRNTKPDPSELLHKADRPVCKRVVQSKVCMG